MSATFRGRGGRRAFPARRRHPTSSVKVNFGAIQVPYLEDDAELILKSEDGVVFKVHSSALRTGSEVFRNMLRCSAAMPLHVQSKDQDCPEPDSAKPSPNGDVFVQPPIEISSPSIVVRLFVDLLYHAPLLNTISDTHGPTPTPAEALAAQRSPSTGLSPHFADIFRTANANYTGPKNGVACLTALLELLDRFDCAFGLRQRALAHFESTIDSKPWAVLIIADKYDDMELARKAIGMFAAISSDELWKVQPETIRDKDAVTLPLPWLMGYLRAHAQVSSTQNHLPADRRDAPELFCRNVATAFKTSTPDPPTSAQRRTNDRRSLPVRMGQLQIGGYAGQYVWVAPTAS